jgi:hypothetical protein
MKYFYILFLLFIVGCGTDHDETATEEVSTSLYPDDTYCADITYHNPKTGTRHTYTLNVEVESNQMIKIYWGNGGWLDDSHFTPEELDGNGECSFVSDKGYEYEIKITGSECTNTDNPTGEDEMQGIRLTLLQCASAIQMTEAELTEYEKDFKASRTDDINEEMCNSIREYIGKIRKINGKIQKINGKLDALNEELENGLIENIYVMSAYGEISCQQMLVKKKGVYYWLEVQGLTKSTMGTVQFDHTTSNWQRVSVKEGPESTSMKVFSMRIMDQGRDMASLKAKMHNYCQF